MTRSRVPRINPDTNRPEEEFFLGEDSSITFKQLAERIPSYKNVLYVSGLYEVYISRASLHWYLLVKLHGSELPFVTLEITRGADKTSFVAMMYVLEDDRDKELLKLDENTSLHVLCDVADEVKQKMGCYDLLSNNCQHFCNNVLKWLNYEQFKTTTNVVGYGPSTLGYDELGFDAWPAIEENRKNRNS